MFRVVAPLAPKHDIAKLVEAGADEFYCGLVALEEDLDLVRMSRRPWLAANFTSAAELEAATRSVHERGRRVLLTLNSHYVEPVARARFEATLRLVRDIGMDGVIVGSLSLLLLVRELFETPGDFTLAASTCLGITNDAAVSFFASLGISQVILPRHLTPAEIRQLCERHPSMAFEFFVLNERCAFYESCCGMMHGGSGGLQMEIGCRRVGDPMISELFREDACGACELYQLAGLRGPLSVKVVGRGRPADAIVRDVGFVSAAIDAVDQARDDDDYREIVRALYLATHGAECARDCHFPRRADAC